MKDIILILFLVVGVSFLAALTRGDRKNIGLKTVVGTGLGIVIYVILKFLK